jgi:hypothetical protein
MKVVTVRAVFQLNQDVEVPDDYEFAGNIDSVWAEQLDPGMAELVDWDIIEYMEAE